VNPSPTPERLHSPDRRDVLPSVNHPPMRMALAGGAILFAVCFAWLGFGQVETRVQGRCILLSGGGVLEIASAAEGRLAGLAVQAGDKVAKGQVVGRLQRADFDQRLARAEARLADLTRRQREGAGMIARSRTLGDSGVAAEQQGVAARLGTLERRIVLTRERLAAQQKLLADGLATRQSLLAAQAALESLSLEQAALKSRSRQLAFSGAEEQRALGLDERKLELQVKEAERELAVLRRQQEELMVVRSQYAGTVIEVKAQDGMAMASGTPVATIELEPDRASMRTPLVAVIFTDASAGKLLHAGMPAEITPSNVKRQEFGFIRAVLGEVSPFPVSRAGIAQLLHNPDVARELAGDKVMTLARAGLIAAGDGNGFAWSSAARNPPAVHSGSMCNADVVVRKQRPIAMVWPALKKLAGI
jgi:HlyD family secretion protein